MKRSVLLDLLRITAITLVIIAHLGQLLSASPGEFFGIKNFYYVSLGGVGVSLFLILSGVLTGLSASSKATSYLSYMVKKILRIYPLYLLSVPFSLIGYILAGILLEGEIPKLFPNGIVVDLIASLTGFYSWFGLWGGPYNPPSWFISLIMVIYAIAPVLLFTLNRWPGPTMVTLLVLSSASRWYIGQNGLPFIDTGLFAQLQGWAYRLFGFMPGRPGDWFPLCRLFEFALGIYLAMVIPKRCWFKLRPRFTTGIYLLSDLAFPLFLLHYPFLFVVVLLAEAGVANWAALAIFITFILLLSLLVNQVDTRIPRKKIEQQLLKRITGHCKQR